MSDIVERLHGEAARDDHRGAGLILGQAATEIEQLRRDLSHAKAMQEVWKNRAYKAEDALAAVGTGKQP